MGEHQRYRRQCTCRINFPRATASNANTRSAKVDEVADNDLAEDLLWVAAAILGLTQYVGFLLR